MAIWEKLSKNREKSLFIGICATDGKIGNFVEIENSSISARQCVCNSVGRSMQL